VEDGGGEGDGGSIYPSISQTAAMLHLNLIPLTWLPGIPTSTMTCLFHIQYRVRHLHREEAVEAAVVLLAPQRM